VSLTFGVAPGLATLALGVLRSGGVANPACRSYWLKQVDCFTI
jgi:hypothetical protein